MSGRTRLGIPTLFARHLNHGIGASIIVALLVGVSVFATALAPRALVALGTDEVRSSLSAASPMIVDITGTGRFGYNAAIDDPTLEEIIGPTDARLDDLPGQLPLPLRAALDETEWIARASALDVIPDGPIRARILLTLAVDLGWSERVDFVEGAAPVAWTGGELPEDAEEPTAPPIEIAVSAQSARILDVEVGDVVDSDVGTLAIAGIYEPVRPEDGYWAHATDLVRASVDQPPGSLPTIRAGVFVHQETLVPLRESFASGQLSAWLPLVPSTLEFAEIAEVRAQVREFVATPFALPDFGELAFRSGLPDIVERTVGRLDAASALLALVGSGLFGVLLAVFALGVRSVIERRAPGLALASARGAGTGVLRGAMAVEGLLLAVPVSGLAIAAAAVLVPTDAGWPGWVLPTLVGLAPPVLFAVLTSPRALVATRRDLAVRSAHPGRWVLEAGIVGLAAISLVLLARRGLVESSGAVGVDPLLAAMPLLVATAVGVLVLRVVPFPLLAVLRFERAAGPATGLVGAARAVRAPALGFPATIALVIGIAVVVSSAVLATTVRTALAAAAVEGVGADLRVQARELPDDLLERIADTDGVAAAAPVSVASGVRFADAAGDSEIFVVVADTALLSEIRPDIEPLETGSPVPILVSEDWQARIVPGDLELDGAAVTVAGTLPRDALPGVNRRWALLDAAAADRMGLEVPDPEQVLIRLDPLADSAGVASALDELVAGAQSDDRLRAIVVVRDAATELEQARTAPTTAGLERLLLLAAGASLALTIIAVVLGSVAAAGARAKLFGLLRVLGMSSRQLRRVLAWELGPVVLTATIVGTGLGLALPAIITSVLDLRPFVGGRTQPGPDIDPLSVGVAVAVFLVAVAIAGLVAAAISRRVAPAGALKMGEG